MLPLGIPAILIIPRVRRYVVILVNERFGVNLASRISKVVTSVLYTLLTLIAVMSTIGEGINDPQGSVGISVLMILMHILLR